MKFLASIITAVVLLSAGCDKPREFYAQPQKFDIQTVLNETALVDVSDGYGSGVIVSKYEGGHWVTYVWTAAHVVSEEIAHVKVRLTKDFVGVADYSEVTVVVNGKSAKAEILGYSKEIDIALLRVKDQDFSRASVHFLTGKPEVLGRLYHVGNFYGPRLTNSVSTGIVSAVGRLIGDREYDQLSIPTYPGSSGGGMFDEAGNCIGLCSRRSEELISMIVPARVIVEWATKTGHANAL